MGLNSRRYSSCYSNSEFGPAHLAHGLLHYHNYMQLCLHNTKEKQVSWKVKLENYIQDC